MKPSRLLEQTKCRHEQRCGICGHRQLHRYSRLRRENVNSWPDLDCKFAFPTIHSYLYCPQSGEYGWCTPRLLTDLVIDVVPRDVPNVHESLAAHRQSPATCPPESHEVQTPKDWVTRRSMTWCRASVSLAHEALQEDHANISPCARDRPLANTRVFFD